MTDYIDDPLYSVSCALPALRPIAFVIGSVVVAVALVVVLLNRLRP